VRDSRHFVSRDEGFYLKLALEVQPPRRNDDLRVIRAPARQ
jgi:hypothetical protein